MIIDCIADLHGHFPKLEGADLLIVAGDLTARDAEIEYMNLAEWFGNLPYGKIIIIAGNHDNLMINHEEPPHRFFSYLDPKVKYLCDSGTELGGLKIWGSPHSLTFPRINPICAAFTGTEEDLEEKYQLIPDDIDILITHTPPYGILDENVDRTQCGSKSLLKAIARIKPKLVIHGHIHEAYGKHHMKWNSKSGDIHKNDTIFVNCSHVNEHYRPVNKPVRIVL